MEKTAIAINGNFLEKPFSGCGQYTRELLAQQPFKDATIFTNTPAGGYQSKYHNVPIKTIYPRRDRIQQLLFEQKVGKQVKTRYKALWSPYHSTTTGSVPHIMTIHDAIGYMPKWNDDTSTIGKIYKKRALKAAENATHIITISHYAKQQIVSHLQIPEIKISVIYPGINTKTYKQESDEVQHRIRQQYELPEKYAVYVGGFERRKNVDLMLEALNNQKEPLHLLIIGNPPEHVSKQLNKNTTTLSGIEDDQKAALLASATVFLWPSLEEGFGIPPLEAMACNTPVIANKCSAMPEVLGEAPIWCTPSPESWIQAMDNLKQTSIEVHTSRGKDQVEKYQWSSAANKIAAIIQRHL